MTVAPRYAAIVLAAGRSSRFSGGHKLLADLRGKPLIHHTLEAVAASSVNDIVLVVSSTARQAIEAAAGTGRWSVCINTRAAEGLSTSLQAAVAALPSGLNGALVVLGDMPGVTPNLIARILQLAQAYPDAIVYPLDHSGQQGHPVYWPCDILAEFSELTGDQGGKPLLRRHAHRIVTLEADEMAAFDIDTAEDLAAYEAHFKKS